MSVSLIIAEASLELVPRDIRSHRSVSLHAGRLGKRPSEILLDNSWHYAAMRGMPDWHKRGRPDIVHQVLLAATSTPLFMRDILRVYLHTVENRVISISPGTRLPKSYHRFAGLAEDVLCGGAGGLLKLEEMGFGELLDHISAERIIGLSHGAVPSTYENVASMLDDSCVVVGGFQKGDFGDAVSKSLTSRYSVDELPLEAHVVAGRVLYEYEKRVMQTR